MKIKARTNGDVIDLNDEGAKQLIEAGIYDPVDEKPEPKDARQPTSRKSR